VLNKKIIQINQAI